MVCGTVARSRRRPLVDPQHMSTNATDETDAGASEAAGDRRYAELNIGDEEYVIYDRQNHQAWVQSSVAVGVDDLR